MFRRKPVVEADKKHSSEVEEGDGSAAFRRAHARIAAREAGIARSR